MHLHKRDRALIGGNIRLEIIHESNPYFAGEPICMLIRLKHLGSQHQKESLQKRITALEEKKQHLSAHINNDDTKPWLVKTLWNTFHQEDTFRDETLQQRISALQKKLEFHESVDLMSCFVQIVGQYYMDEAVVNVDSLDAKSTSHQLAGVGSKNTINDNDSPISNVISSFFNTSIDDVLQKTSPLMSAETVDTNDWFKAPFLLIPQTLLFSELVLEAGEARAFKFKTDQLAKDLPPSHTNSAHFNITYTAQMGISTNAPNDIPHQNLYNFPIFVQPFVDKDICQYDMPLDREVLITSPGKVRDIGNTLNSTTPKGSISQSNQLDREIRRKSITNTGKNSETSIDVMKRKFRSVVSDWNENEDPDLPISSLLEQQFETEPSTSARMNLSQFYFSGVADSLSRANEDHSLLQPQLNSLQTEYIVKMNDKFICNLELSTPVYSVLDQIDLTLDFRNADSKSNFNVTAVSASIETFELINPKYSLDHDVSKKKPTGILIYETQATNFDNCNKICMKLIPQCSPSTFISSQFKTNVFQLRWMLTFKFVMIPLGDQNDEITLTKTYEDRKGTLYHAKRDMEGYDFVFHVPLTVLPTEKQLAGW
ncbi:unnamed protein product [Kluyveromyces dobzhanskii CBS 2104]|uniref:WGS project CCBQ000000000 data, contig 00015 n=1 Tax=Kluyveromyces dobzhanskii CBS 2104 TaxID=1427455 RepID=A0A0A8LCM5_9SACH|nr:unnamed protein product [Kluyveromyces dobzhanskii CBS 2104]